MGLLKTNQEDVRAANATESARSAHAAGKRTFVVTVPGRLAPLPKMEAAQIIDDVEDVGWMLEHVSTAAWRSDKHETGNLILTLVFRRAQLTA